MTDIVDRLREGGCSAYCDETERRAADEIVSLRAQLAAAESERERLQGACDLYRQNQIADLARLAEAEALLDFCVQHLECGEVHHEKHEYHKAFDPCPVMARLHAFLGDKP